MIRVEDAGLRIGAARLLSGIGLHLPAGSFTAVLGPNGAGKTTLLRLIAGDLAPSEGRVLFDGAPLAATPGLARRRAVVSQHNAVAFDLSVAEMVALGRLPHRAGAAAQDDRAALAAVRAAFELAGLWDRPLATLSGGERQRAQLARAAAQLWRRDGDGRGTVLLLDEPAAALDLAQQATALRFARRMAAGGAAVLAVLHDPNHAAAADQVVMLRQGRLLAAGPRAAVLTADRLGACLGVAVDAVARPDGPAVFVPAWL